MIEVFCMKQCEARVAAEAGGTEGICPVGRWCVYTLPADPGCPPVERCVQVCVCVRAASVTHMSMYVDMHVCVCACVCVQRSARNHR